MNLIFFKINQQLCICILLVRKFQIFFFHLIFLFFSKYIKIRHLPKCKAPKVSEAKFKCDSCEELFLSQKGLSMHEMHRHPATRNPKTTQNTSRENTRPVSRASVWSKKETELLIKLNERYKHLKQLNVALKEIFFSNIYYPIISGKKTFFEMWKKK